MRCLVPLGSIELWIVHEGHAEVFAVAWQRFKKSGWLDVLCTSCVYLQILVGNNTLRGRVESGSKSLVGLIEEELHLRESESNKDKENWNEYFNDESSDVSTRNVEPL